MPAREAYLDAWAGLHGGHDPRSGGRAERGWFAAMYALGRPLAARGVAPDALTAAALAVGLAAPVAVAAGARWVPPALVAASSVLDGLDGTVAALAGRPSAWGHLADSLGDRLAEAAFGAALAVAGAPVLLCAGAVGVGWLQEYARARAGTDAILVVTVAERPTRVIAATLGLLGAAAVPSAAGACATLGAAAWLGLGAAGAAQLLRALRAELA